MILVKFNKEIKGTSSVEGHKDEIVFDSYSFNAARHVTVQGDQRDIGQAYLSEFVLTKMSDVTSPELFISTLRAEQFKSATIALMRTAGNDSKPQKLVEFHLNDPIITGFSTQCSGDDRPMEQVTLNFSSIKYTYFNISGGVAGGDSARAYSIIKDKKD